MNSHFYNYALICISFALGINEVICSAGESNLWWPWPSSLPNKKPWESESEEILPTATLLPPDWNEDAYVEAGDLGSIQGFANLTLPLLGSRKFLSFAGIPYALPDSYTKGNRFKPSKVWTGTLTDDDGTFLATDFSIKCPQDGSQRESEDFREISEISWNQTQMRNSRIDSGISIQEQGQEECLVLNIDTPSVSRSEDDLMPVIVFIHGGSFDSMWSGMYRGHRFLKKDVVYVSINYRLGSLGFLNLAIDDAPGNAALYDILTGLKWIKKYIHFFGGKKSSITVIGHSAGAVLATHLLTSELAFDDDDEPLLHGIIGLSGSSISQTLATSNDPLPHHLQVAQLAGCPVDGAEGGDKQKLKEIRDCMAAKPVKELVEAMNEYTKNEIRQGRFGLEPKLPSLQDPSRLVETTAFMTDIPYNVLQDRKQKLNVPVMMGVTRHDGSYLVDQTLEQFWRPNNLIHNPLFLRNELLPTLIGALNLEDHSGELIHSLENMYVGDAIHNDNFEDKLPGLIDIYSVLAFKAGAYNLVELNSKKNPKSYYFSFEYSPLWLGGGSDAVPGGVGHMDILIYLFQRNPLVLPNDLSVSNELIDLLVKFATFDGNPNGESRRTTVAPYNPYNHAYLKIDGSFRTAYYCRDAWVNNSIELMKKEPEIPSSTVTSTPTTEETTESSPTENTSSTRKPVTGPSTTPSAATKMKLNSLALIIIGCFLFRSMNS